MAIRGAEMKTAAHARTNLCGFLGVVTLSALTMIWLFWHHPLATGVATLVVLTIFGNSARLASWVESEGLGSEARRLFSDTEAGEDFPQ